MQTIKLEVEDSKVDVVLNIIIKNLKESVVNTMRCLMYPRVKDVKPTDDYKLILTFTNGEVKVFDVTPCLDKGFFKQLKDKSYFKS